MHVTQIMYSRLKGQKVKITCKSFFSGAISHVYEGVVVNATTTHVDYFIELDTGDLINTKYIESIKIVGPVSL